MLVKIISGGQTGVDRAALVVAKKFGLATGGWMPKQFRAKDGRHPEFAALYGIKEHYEPGYPARTRLNVQQSDGTVRIATFWLAPGERATIREIKKLCKPYFDLDILGDRQPADLANWITASRINVLNVAGHTELRAPGVGEFTEAFLTATLEILKAHGGLILEVDRDRSLYQDQFAVRLAGEPGPLPDQLCRPELADHREPLPGPPLP